MSNRFQFEQPADLEIVRRIVTTPAIYRASSDDGCGPADQFQVPSKCAYALARDEDETLLGCYGIEPHNSVSIEIHTCLLPIAWGRAEQITTAFREWLWQNTSAKRITTRVPSFNRLALRLAMACGMVEFGRDVKSFQKHGRLYDEILLGISKEVE
jgi:RimJ/RimL family protein N-acetyltransferase